MDYHSQKRNLFYNVKDFVNIHTALKCSSLVILSGLSGTGKSAIVKIHNRPDILIHVYDVEKEWYLGAIVLECKYRKINSFWTENGGRSSIGQLQAYYNNTRSDYHFGGKGKRLNIRPVKKVIVLTPDIHGDGRSQEDFGILVKSFKPTDTGELVESVIDQLNAVISELKEISQELQW